MTEEEMKRIEDNIKELDDVLDEILGADTTTSTE